ncbi:hypothetical protein [Prauserella muralis]|nr:hypothetical protein [Prauserella muralis]
MSARATEQAIPPRPAVPATGDQHVEYLACPPRTGLRRAVG